MKKIKFADDLVSPIINEKRTVTVRVDSNISINDTLVAITQNYEKFAILESTIIIKAPVSDSQRIIKLFDGNYPDTNMVEYLNEYYDDISKNTIVDIIFFECIDH